MSLGEYLDSAEFALKYLNAILEVSYILAFISVFIYILNKDKMALRYSCLCSAFYIIGFFTFHPLIEHDPDRVYRYIVWALNDIIFIAIVAYWALRDKMYMWQSIMVQLVVLPAPLLQLFRLVDIHLMDASYSAYFYRTVLPIVNFMTVMLCFAPLVMYFGKRAKQLTWLQGKEKEG
ncbi:MULTISPECIES: hypothetical protein [Pseudoalteromonas]|uniref:Uncharacterized protein n=1 Tax=Pseudoalteromonas obscura TaxID=3048491 RepID=A0ABT7EIK2_9GAMM|nr:hypothetical protein [Pseudoalteromonas sp. P94(2023)]MBQ4838422.1 hypothetical protein [Pseudoalteromonas luteoviolacea]MDK2594886.1 hypothetical protein [Pseudoalteromonas sp. P94(2023)]